MIINHNISAMNSQRNFGIHVKKTDENLEKLASGQRINSGKDDPAAFAVSEKMRSQIRGFKQASRNIQDGVNLVQTIEGHLGEAGQIIQRMRELSVQASNGTYTNEDRSQISVEMDELIKEMNRIHEDAKFNTIRLLDGYSLGQNSFGGEAPTGYLNASRSIHFNKQNPDGGDPQKIAKNGLVIQAGPNTDERMFVKVDPFSTYTLGLTSTPENTYRDLNGVDNDNHAWREVTFYDWEDTNLDSIMYLENGIDQSPKGDVNIQLSAPRLEKIRVNVATSEKSTETIAALDIALNKISKQRADLGAFQRRLEMAHRGVNMATENIQSAESKIRDSDMAKEYVELTKHQILTNSSASVTAQANYKSDMVFKIIE